MFEYKSEDSYKKVIDAQERGRATQLIQYEQRIKDYNNNPKLCLNCNDIIEYDKRFNKFCSKKCSATFNNKTRRKNRFCLMCNKELIKYQKFFCSNKCSLKYREERYIEKWLKGEVSGGTEKDPQEVSKYVRNYMLKKADYKCENCGWSKVNPYSNTIPVELDHIDGHSENNKIENLRVLCPSCHSLTPYYCSLNNGNGRRKFRELWRKENGR